MNLVYAIHGIMTRQTIADWPDRFDAWCAHRNVNAHVERKEYLAAPLPLWNQLVRNPLLARACEAEIVEFHTPDFRPKVSFVAHSNGTDIALRTIKKLARRGIKTDTFIAIGSVLEADVEKNGVADLVRCGWLRNAVAYCSDEDMAIGVGRFTTYGSLGVDGWLSDGESVRNDFALTRWFPGYGHGDYFTDANREQTFAQIREDLGL